MPRISLILALLVGLPVVAGVSAAQQRPGASGVLHVTDWPGSTSHGREVERNAGQYEVLPYVDTLTVGYRYEVLDGQPVVALAVEWQPGAYGILDGRKVRYAELPDSLYLTAASITADVYMDGREAGQVNFRLEDVEIGPHPDLHAPDPYVVEWKDLFENVPAEQARAWFERGFELRNPNLLAAAFETYDGASGAYASGERVVVRRRPSRRSVVIVDNTADVFIDLTWLLWPRSGRGRVVVDDDAPDALRGDQVGRTGNTDRDDRAPRSTRTRNSAGNSGDSAESGERTRGTDVADGQTTSGESTARTTGRRTSRPSSSSDNSSDEDEEEDDDDKELLPAALTAVAAVGVLAYAGGTVGYFGNTKFAPIGASAGMVRPEGGFFMQASVNEAVLGDAGPERLLAKLVAFHAVSPMPIQPAVGAGVLVTRANNETSYQPSLSLGAVGNFGPLVLFGAYDVALGGWEISAAFNFRSRPGR